jgi:hypothetical protein
MTPRQFAYLDKRYKYALQREEYLTGLLASVTANYAFGSKTQLEPADFPLPTLKKRPDPLPTDDELAEQLNSWASTHAVPKR